MESTSGFSKEIQLRNSQKAPAQPFLANSVAWLALSHLGSKIYVRRNPLKLLKREFALDNLILGLLKN